jgi:hypothetical protein
MLFMCAYFFITQTADQTPKTSKPVTLQLPEATPQALSNANQEIIGLKQQLLKLKTSNNQLTTLLNQKKEIRSRIDAHYALMQKQLQQNNAFNLELQAALSKKPLDTATKRKLMEDNQKIKVDNTLIANMHTTLQEIKTKINRIAPDRKATLKKLHEKQKFLKQLQLSAEVAKAKDRV